MNKSFFIFILLSILVAAVFIIFPQIDLYVSGLFYNKEADKFLLARNPILNFIHDSTKIVVIAVLVGLIAAFIFVSIKKQDFLGLSKKKILYLFFAMAIGPGLVVNGVFKENWGRARPSQIEQFSGDKSFSPPFIIADQCDTNCSFVSGDPSVGFYFFAFMIAFPLLKKRFFLVAMNLGIIFGSARIMMGAHFLSDVIFSGVFTYLSVLLLGKVFWRKNLA